MGQGSHPLTRKVETTCSVVIASILNELPTTTSHPYSDSSRVPEYWLPIQAKWLIREIQIPVIASQKVVGSNPSVGKNVYHENSVKIHLYDHRAVEFYIKHVRDVLCFFCLFCKCGRCASNSNKSFKKQRCIVFLQQAHLEKSTWSRKAQC